MSEPRRPLQFSSIDDIMPEVENLLAGHTTVGTWSLAQICNHLATVMRRVLDLPASTPRDPSQELGEEFKRQVFETGQLPRQIPTPPALIPKENLNPQEEADRLRQAIAAYKASPTGPVAPHRVFGPLTKEEWDRLQLIHCAHHLSFAVPTETKD